MQVPGAGYPTWPLNVGTKGMNHLPQLRIAAPILRTRDCLLLGKKHPMVAHVGGMSSVVCAITCNFLTKTLTRPSGRLGNQRDKIPQTLNRTSIFDGLFLLRKGGG